MIKKWFSGTCLSFETICQHQGDPRPLAPGWKEVSKQKNIKKNTKYWKTSVSLGTFPKNCSESSSFHCKNQWNSLIFCCFLGLSHAKPCFLDFCVFFSFFVFLGNLVWARRPPCQSARQHTDSYVARLASRPTIQPASKPAIWAARQSAQPSNIAMQINTYRASHLTWPKSCYSVESTEPSCFRFCRPTRYFHLTITRHLFSNWKHRTTVFFFCCRPSLWHQKQNCSLLWPGKCSSVESTELSPIIRKPSLWTSSCDGQTIAL